MVCGISSTPSRSSSREAGGEDAVALRLLFRRQRLVHGEAADIGDDRRTLGLGKELLQPARDVDHGLGLLQRIAAQASSEVARSISLLPANSSGACTTKPRS